MRIGSFAGMLKKPETMSIYIHIPFCVSKCSYCNFCSFANCEKFIDSYLKTLYREIDYRASEYANKKITTIYIGGGTPSVLPLGEIDKLITYIRKKFTVLYNESVTVEINPESFTKDKAREYLNAGVDRVSVGLQSTEDDILRLLNRPHNYNDFERTVDILCDVGITDINADILLGVPTQTMHDVDRTLDKILKQPLTHISAYGLIVEPKTIISQKINSGELKPINEDLAADMYDYTVKRLAEQDYIRYEISNFSRIGYQSEHNLNYWARGCYLGLGLSSHSFIDGVHWKNTDKLSKYLAYPTNCKEEIENETVETAKFETIMLALRTEQGLNIDRFNKKFNTDFLTEYKSVINKLQNDKLITIACGYVYINNFNISNSIIAEFSK